MTLIKFGKTYVNFDNVTCIRDLTLTLSGGGTSTGVVRIEFAKDYHVDLVDGYQSVKDWLAENAIDPPTPTLP